MMNLQLCLGRGWGPKVVMIAAIFRALVPLAAHAQEGPDPNTIVDNFEKSSGVHRGDRRNHAKGVCAFGSFMPSSAVKALSISPLFAGVEIPVIARLSVSGPNPAIPDTAKVPHGLALLFQLPGGQQDVMSMIHAPMFFAATPADFLERQEADLPDPATGQRNPAKLAAYSAKHPESKAWASFFASHTAPVSYAETAYYSVHAFHFIDASKQKHTVKWRFVPRDGERFFTEAEYATAPKTFLEPGLMERVQKGPIVWDMIVTLGEPGDPEDNPTALWPAGRREINAGALTLTKAEPQSSGACDPVLFDPNLLSPGIEPSPDPILAFRSLAYAVSYGRRTSEKAK